MAKYIALAFIVLACVLGWLLKESYEENGALENALASQVKANKEMIKRAIEYEQTLLEREKAIEELNKEKGKFYEELQEARKNQVFRDWGDELLPVDVFSLLESSSSD